MQYLKRLVNLTLLLTPLIFWTSLSHAFELPKQIFFKSAVLLALFLLARQGVKDGFVQLPQVLKLKKVKRVVLAFLLLVILGTLFSLSYKFSFYGTYFRNLGTHTLLHFLVFFVVVTAVLQKKADYSEAMYSLGFGAVISFSYAIFQGLGFSNFPLQEMSLGRVFGTFGHPNYFAHFSVLVMLGFLPFLFDKKKRNFAALLVILGLTGLILSASRGAIVGMGVGVMFFALFYGIVWKKRAIVLASMLVPVVFAGALLMSGRVDFNSENLRSLGTRAEIWEASFEAIEESKLFGHGVETFPLAISPHLDSEVFKLEKINSLPTKAHNSVLEILVEHGLIGLFLWIFFVFSVFSMGMKGLYSKRNLHILGIMSGFAGALTMNMFGFSSTSEMMLLSFYLAYLAFLLSDGTCKWSIKPLMRKFLPVLVGIFTFGSLIFVNMFDLVAEYHFTEEDSATAAMFKPEQSHYHYHAALEALKIGDKEKALGFAELGGLFKGERDHYYYYLKGEITGDRENFAKAYELFPAYAPTLKSWTTKDVLAGDCESANKHFQMYLSTVPDHWQDEGTKAQELFYKHNKDFDEIFDVIRTCGETS